ncbi:MAG: RibD family protein [Anaerolineae bacterium]|nr:RibD family protein [Caldilineales bacterium]MCX7852135.1 RibD family protein [Caldilineales bacterium]MDW8269120.1 RibD family protein [Anaerolineae bacterium]
MIADPLASLFDRLNIARPTWRPFVTLSYAQSLDGSIALVPGVHLDLSSPPALAFTHRLRSAHDAILVGIGTVLADNPRLTVRLWPGPQPQPVVLDSHLRLPDDAALWQHPRPPWVATIANGNPTRGEALAARGARLLWLPPAPDGGIHLAVLLTRLAELGIGRLMVEGGSRVITAFLAARLVDLVVVTVTPHLVGGLRGVRFLGQSQQAPLLALAQPQWTQIGPDLVVWGMLSTNGAVPTPSP